MLTTLLARNLSAGTDLVTPQIMFELADGTWADITADLMSGNTSRGRSNELDRFRAGTARVLLRNEDRTYDPNYTSSAYNGSIVPMRRIQILAMGPGGASSIDLPGTSGNYVSTPDSAAVSITGSIDLRVCVAMDDWTPSVTQQLIAKWNSTGVQLSYLFQVQTDGTLRLVISNDGTTSHTHTSTVAVAYANGSAHWVRATFDAAGDVYFYTSENGTTWTQLGANVASTPTAIFDSTTLVALGSNSNDSGSNYLAGNLYYAEIRNGVGGAVAAKFDPANSVFPTSTTTPTTLVSQTGETWTANGSSWVWEPYPSLVTHKIFTGYVDSWRQIYTGPYSGNAEVQLTDIFKVLQNKTLRSSPFAQEVTTDGPLSWWRLGEASGSTTAFDSIGPTNLTSPSGTPTFGATSLITSESDTAMSFDATSDGIKTGQVTLPISTGPLTVEFFINTATASIDNIISLVVASGSYGVQIDSTGANLEFIVATPSGGTTTVASSATLNNSTTHHIACVWDSAGAMTIYQDGVSVGTGTNSSLSFGATEGFVAVGAATIGVAVNGFIGTIDDIVLYDSALSATRVLAHYNAAATAWASDTPAARAGRIGDIAALPTSDRVFSTGTSALQAASISGQSALDHLQLVADSDFGVLYADKNGAVDFEGRADSVNQPVLGVFADAHNTGDDVSMVDPEYTDQQIRNEATIQRRGGVAVTYTDDTSVTAYLTHAYSKTGLEFSSDVVAVAAARYVVNKYKDPQQRISRMVLEPRKDRGLFAQALSRELTDRITVVYTPQNVGSAFTQSTIIEGIAHEFGPKMWRTTFQLSPADATAYWELGVSGFSELGTTTRIFF